MGNMNRQTAEAMHELLCAMYMEGYKQAATEACRSDLIVEDRAPLVGKMAEACLQTWIDSSLLIHTPMRGD